MNIEEITKMSAGNFFTDYSHKLAVSFAGSIFTFPENTVRTNKLSIALA